MRCLILTAVLVAATAALAVDGYPWEDVIWVRPDATHGTGTCEPIPSVDGEPAIRLVLMVDGVEDEFIFCWRDPPGAWVSHPGNVYFLAPTGTAHWELRKVVVAEDGTRTVTVVCTIANNQDGPE